MTRPHVVYDSAKRDTLGVWGPGGGAYDPKIRIRERFLYSAPSRYVSSSLVKSFGSYRVDKQTNKQIDAAENIHLVSLCYAGG